MISTFDSNAIYDQAAAWAAKLDAGELDREQQAAFDAWIAADGRHYGAFAQACAHLLPLAEVASNRASRFSRRQIAAAGVAASLASLGVVGAFAKRWFGEERYSTQIGELKIIPLSDGSVVSLNTDSEIAVRFMKDLRSIDLVQGEALFDVAKDKARPFVVSAGNTQVRAVGTSFTVSLLPAKPVEVLVREGIVEVTRPEAPVAPAVRLAQDTRAVAPRNAPIVAASIAPSEVTRVLAWRVGRIAFHGETLQQAADEFARYSDIHIRVDDPAIAKERVTGLFVSADPIGFARAVASSFGLQATVSDREIIISRQPT